MEIIEGKRSGTRKFLYEGYAYHHDTTSAGHGTYRCARRSTIQCRRSVRIGTNEEVVSLQSHNHAPNRHIAEEARIKEILRLCRETLRSYDDIFRDVSLRYQAAASRITLHAMTSAMVRERNKSHPPTPNNLVDFDGILRNHQATRDFYCGLVRACDGSSALVFGMRSMIQRLNNALEIFVDATFRVVPKKPKVCQLLILHIRSMNVSFPVLYILCSRRTTSMYIALWEFILNLAPGLRVTLRTVISDYERAIHASARQVFPRVQLRGCWFHYCQAVHKRWRKLRLARAPREVLWMSMSLPLVTPTTRFEEGLNLVAEIGNELMAEYPAISQFFAYMRRQWLPIAHVVTVGRASLRTNNICETFHRHISGRLGGYSHPNVWVFLERLSYLTRSQEISWLQVHNGHPITRGSTAQQVLKDARIATLQDNLSSGTLTLTDFLRGVMEHHRRAAMAIEN